MRETTFLFLVVLLFAGSCTSRDKSNFGFGSATNYRSFARLQKTT